MRNHFPGGPELLDDQEASRFLHQHALALVVHVVRSDDKPDRDAANELVLADRERNKFLTSRVRALKDKRDDLGVFAALSAPFVDLPAQSLIQRGSRSCFSSFAATDQLPRAGGIRSGESSLHDQAGRTAEHAQIVGATRKGTLPTGPEQAAAAAGSLSLRDALEAARRGLGAARRGSTPRQRGGAIQRELKVGLKRASLAALRQPSDP
jgi:hypothetical protein